MKDISYWLDTDSRYEPRPALVEDAECDIVIVGGGIIGVSAAYHCAKAGFKTVLLEKGEIASGSAGKNGGMVVERFAVDFAQAAQEFGMEKAAEAWQRTRDAREHVIALTSELGIDCDFLRPGSLYLGNAAAQIKMLENELSARK